MRDANTYQLVLSLACGAFAVTGLAAGPRQPDAVAMDPEHLLAEARRTTLPRGFIDKACRESRPADERALNRLLEDRLARVVSAAGADDDAARRAEWDARLALQIVNRMQIKSVRPVLIAFLDKPVPPESLRQDVALTLAHLADDLSLAFELLDSEDNAVVAGAIAGVSMSDDPELARRLDAIWERNGKQALGARVAASLQKRISWDNMPRHLANQPTKADRIRTLAAYAGSRYERDPGDPDVYATFEAGPRWAFSQLIQEYRDDPDAVEQQIINLVDQSRGSGRRVFLALLGDLKSAVADPPATRSAPAP
jgi:hypothetical protein